VSRANRPPRPNDCPKGRPSSTFLSGPPYMKTPSESKIAIAHTWAQTTAGHGRRSEPKIASVSGDGTTQRRRQ